MRKHILNLALASLLFFLSVCPAQADTMIRRLIKTSESANYNWTGSHNFGAGIVELPNGTAPTGTDCDDAAEAGRIFVDTNATTGQQIYVCEGAAGWVLQGDGAGGGSGDITDVFNCASGDCASITMAATDLLNMSGVDASTTTEGLILPQHATACAGGVAEGQICWEADADIFHIGDSAGLKDFVSTSAFGGEATVSPTGVVTLADGVAVADWVITGSLAIPQGAAPTVNVAGEIAIDTTDDQIKFYGTAERVIPYTWQFCKVKENPAAADDNVPIFLPMDGITVTRFYCITQGGTSVGVTISDGTNAFEEVVCDADGQADDGSITNAVFTANERMEYDTGTVTGSVSWLTFCLGGVYDAQ